MRAVTHIPKWLLTSLAILFAAATLLYSGLWIYDTRWQLPVELGFDNSYLESEHGERIDSVHPGSPAESAGLKRGDRILKVDGREFENAHTLDDIWARHRPGDVVALTIKRADIVAPLIINVTYRARRTASNEGGLERLGQDIINNTFPLAFLAVGLTVLFLRLEDRSAWLLALMFSGFIAAPSLSNPFQSMTPSLLTFMLAYRAVVNSLVGAFFYFFFAVFPARSPLDRRAPWLKWVGLAIGLCVGLSGIKSGDPRAPIFLTRVTGEISGNEIRLFYIYGFMALGVVSLVGNGLSASTAESRRKIRVILWGTLVGVVPAVLFRGASDFFGAPTTIVSSVAFILLLSVFPLSFAYAVVRHRVLEIPVLLRRSARYLLIQRGFTILLSLLSLGVTWIFAVFLARYLEALKPVGAPGGIVLAAGFGTVLLWSGTRVHRRIGKRIDRAFFRNSYDARVILEELAEKTRTATGRNELAALLEHHLNQALQPSFLAVYFETSDNELSVACGSVPPELQTVSAGDPRLADLRQHGRPRDAFAEIESSGQEPFLLAPLQPDCLVPMLGRDGRLAGLVVLGPRRSEEPYSREDKLLLASVASQAGMALESIRLGERIAERLEAERRAAQDMDFARQVQTRLFPQRLPQIETLEYTGACAPARQVGGDYYDFLELAPGRLALVLADIAGKGVSGALLMANLQANLRGQYAMALEDLPRLLASVNSLFYQNTADNSYATMFFADYNGSNRRLRYVNCGHLPPLLLRTELKAGDPIGSQPIVERLEPTCTVLGLFPGWESEVREVQLDPGDTLLLYTDGITEAANAAGEEFGESRLIETLRTHSHLPVVTLQETIVAAARAFSAGEQADDITLVVARCRFQRPHSQV